MVIQFLYSTCDLLIKESTLLLYLALGPALIELPPAVQTSCNPVGARSMMGVLNQSDPTLEELTLKMLMSALLGRKTQTVI